MKIAEYLYNDELFTEEELRQRAEHFAQYTLPKTMNDVNYITYIFEDGSKFTLGDNGYIGGEW